MTAQPEEMGAFWDARAREDAYFFVDNRIDYRSDSAGEFWAGGVEAVDKVLGMLGASVSPTDTVVEIGCGVGRMTRPLSERADAVVALDVSAEMLSIARRENPALQNVTWLQGNGRDLDGVADASAEACVSFVVFQHIPDAEITLGYVREMGRVLRPGGWSAFQVSNAPGIHKADPAARGRVAQALGRAPRGLDHPAWLGSAVDLDELKGVAGESGLSVERVTGADTQFCLVLLRRA